MEKRISELLEKREEAGLMRKLNPVSARSRSKIRINGKEYIDFSSNDYLGLSFHPMLINACRKATERFGTSAGASRLMSGSMDLHRQLEEETARFKGKEAALVFNSGYQANIGIISSLYKSGDAIFSDRLNHASIIDGILLSGARIFRFQHNDTGHLETLLKKERSKFDKALIISETIFSMDGDRPPLQELVALKQNYNCQLMVDEAHATGLFGENGSGVVEEEKLQEEVDLIMGTFSKALAGFGAYLAASRKVTDYLVNTCRSFIYSTALPPAIIATNLAAIELARSEPYRRERVLDLARHLREKLTAAGLQVMGESQIVPLLIGDTLKAVELAAKLQEQGFWALPVRPPTVPEGSSRLRFSLNFHHDNDHLEKLVELLQTFTILNG